MGANWVVKRRTDISTYLIHWTTRSNFWRIVDSGFFLASFASKEGFWTREIGRTIRGGTRAVCFTEMPVGNYLQSTVADSTRYKRWAIAIRKAHLYAYGGRPVLYGDWNLLGHLEKLESKNERDSYVFLFSGYSPLGILKDRVDWMHEREWRVCPNIELNNRIGLCSDMPSFGQEIEICTGRKVVKRKTEVKGDRLVPIHLPFPDEIGNSRDQLPKRPHFVFLVEAEQDKEEIRRRIIGLRQGDGLPKPLYNAIRTRYSAIAEYRDRYLEVLDKARIVSFETIREERDRRSFWRLEDFIHRREDPHSNLGVLWEKARTTTRRQVLEHIEADLDKGYEYREWRFLPSNRPRTGLLLDPSPPEVRDRIVESEQAVRLLRNDVRCWIREALSITLDD